MKKNSYLHPIIRIIALASVVVVSARASASFRTEPEADGVIKSFMTFLNQGKVTEAVDLVKPHSAANASEMSAFAVKTKADIKDFENKYGRHQGIELVRTCKIGKFFRHSQYVLKFDRGFLTWNFYLYNAGAGWLLTASTWTPEFTPLGADCE